VARFVDHVLADGRGWIATRLDIAQLWSAQNPFNGDRPLQGNPFAGEDA